VRISPNHQDLRLGQRSWSVQVGSQVSHVTQVLLLRFRGKLAHAHVLRHATTKRRDVCASGESGFAGQHQQRPFAKGGEMFKKSGLRLWPASEELPGFSAVTISIDSAFKTGEENDYSVAVVLGEFGRGAFILDVVRYAYPELRAVMVELWQKWHAAAVLVEDKASGQSLIQDLQQNTKLPVRPVKVDGDKLSRAHTVVPTWEAGRVFAVEGAPFLPELMAELTAFPKSAHDDQVDASVQGIRYCTSSSDGRGVFKWLCEEKARKIAEGLLPPDLPEAAQSA
jgi:predicted phage terminase large subunit-like protein